MKSRCERGQFAIKCLTRQKVYLTSTSKYYIPLLSALLNVCEKFTLDSSFV